MKTIAALLVAALFTANAVAGGYKESRKGDLSDDGLTPTVIKLDLGDNVIAGAFGSTEGVVDRDYFTFKIATGQQLSAIRVKQQTQVGGNLSFIGLQKGKQVTVPPEGGSPEGLLGWTHFGTDDEGTDILPAICQGAGAKGCTAPLGSGNYTFWVQELAPCNCQYRFVFRVTAPAD